MRVRILFVVFAMFLTTADAVAQDEVDWSRLSKAQTFAQVSDVITNINRLYARNAQAGAGVTPELLQRSMDVVTELREHLATNPYLRVQSFSLDSGGIQVAFGFP